MPGTESTHREGDFRGEWAWLVAHAVSLGYLVVLLVLAAVAVLPQLFGATASVVQSGSMEPRIGAGDVVLAQPFRPESPVPMGRVVTFDAPAGSAHRGLMLHRIVGMEDDGRLITAGDANADVDSARLAQSHVIGQAFLLVPFIGLPAVWLTHSQYAPFSLWLLVTGVALAIQVLSTTRRRRPPAAALSPAPDGERPETPRIARTAAAAIAALSMVGGLVALLLIAEPVMAGFSARTASLGNQWSMPTAVQPSKLAFTTGPSGASGGTSFSGQPVIAIQGALGEATTGTAPVTLALTTPGGATLSCGSNPVAAVSGVARFSGCRIDLAGTYQLTASSPGLSPATSASFTVGVGAPARVSFASSPGNTARTVDFASQPAVAVKDAGGNTVTTSTVPVTLALSDPNGNLACTTNPKGAIAGVATFAGCDVFKAGTYTLVATSGGLASATSPTFTIFGVPTQLAFVTSPSSSTSGTAFANQPVVAIQDAEGFTTSATNPVTLAITTPAGASLSCTANPRAAANGIATFAGCAIGKAGTYTLTASLTGMTSTTSTSFTISAGPASRLAFTASPSSSVSSTSFATQPTVALLDPFGNVTAGSAPVSLAITTPGGATLACASNPRSAAAGVAVFSGCAIAKAGTYTLTASSNGLTSAVSVSFTITAGAAAKLVFTTSPGASIRGVAFPTQPIVSVRDVAGNPVAATALIVLVITPPTGGATLTCTANPKFTTASTGVVTFSGCRISSAGTFTLTATSGSLTAGVSTSFVVG